MGIDESIDIHKIMMEMITEFIILAHIVNVTVDVLKTSIIMGKKHYKCHCLDIFTFDDRVGTSVIPYVHAIEVNATRKLIGAIKEIARCYPVFRKECRKGTCLSGEAGY